MKEYLFWYPCGAAFLWALNYALARLDIIDTLVPLRYWIIGGFTVAWVPYVNGQASGAWPITLLFMFGVPYGLFLFFSSIGNNDYELPKTNSESELENNSAETSKTPKGTELTLKDYVIVLAGLAVLAAGMGSCIVKNL